MNLKNYFEIGLTYEEYMTHLGDNLALHQQHYKKFKIPEVKIKRILYMKSLNVITITEPWCGDSLAILPVIRKISEINEKWGFKILLRDQNLDLMDQFLTLGGRAVPIFLFLDENFSLIFKWGPRPSAARNLFESHRQQINEGKIEKSEVIKKIRNFYARDKGKAILDDILKAFESNGVL